MAKHPRMVQYLNKVQGLLKEFPTFTIQQVPRAENTHADALASLESALDTQFRRSISVEHLNRPSIEEIKPIDSMQIDEDPSWQDPIIDYLVSGNLPTDKFEARKVGSVDQNSEQMRLNLDLLEGECKKTIIRVAFYQQQLKSYYDKRAKVRQFQPGDLVLRKAFITTPRQGSKNMNPNWEGPYVIISAGPGAEEVKCWTPWMGRKYHDNGMLT
ncbi:unnamed protein product, partial [Prunus brigantina]